MSTGQDETTAGSVADTAKQKKIAPALLRYRVLAPRAGACSARPRPGGAHRALTLATLDGRRFLMSPMMVPQTPLAWLTYVIAMITGQPVVM